VANKAKPITSFPRVPSNKDQIVIDGKKWIYNSSVPGWEALQVTDPIVEVQIDRTEERVSQNLRSGILTGGLISINSSDQSKFDVAGGSGIIVTTTGGGVGSSVSPSTSVKNVSWTASTGVSVSSISSSDVTWVYIDDEGVINQKTGVFSDSQYQDYIILGILVHPNRSSINFTRTFPSVSFGITNQYDDYIRLLGPAKISGHKISGVSGELKLNRSSGTSYVFGSNYSSSALNPNHITDPSQSNCSIWRYYRNSSNPDGFSIQYSQSTINPANYDNNSGSLQSVSASEWTIQRIFYIPGKADSLHVYYGTVKYNSKNEAISGVQTEEFSESSLTSDRAIFCGWMVLKGGASNLSSSNDVEFIQSGIFRNSGGGVSVGGGSGATSLEELTDVDVNSPSINEFLVYDGSNWVNQPFSGVENIDDLLDVDISSLSSNQALIYDGSKWTNQNLPSFTGITFVSSSSAPDVNNYNEGDRWYNLSTGIEYALISDGSGDKFWVNIYISPNEDYILDQLTKITTFISSASVPDVNEYREGDRWFNTNQGKEYTLIDDAGGKQWVNLHTEFIAHTHSLSEIINTTNYITTSTYTLSSSDYYVGVDYAGIVTITLPQNPEDGKTVIIKDESGEAGHSNKYITIVPYSGSDTIDNGSSATININNGGIQLIYRNGWRIV